MNGAGNPNTPVPAGTQVFRLARAASNGEPSYTAFELSSADQMQAPPRLSVWLAHMRQPQQARELIDDPLLYTFALYLLTDTIRRIYTRLPNTQVQITPLDVVWDPLPTPPGYLVRPSWIEGHCGITGLKRPPGMPRDVYKTLRVLLLQAAEVVRIPNGL
jgi:hypothetical protein